MGVMLTRRSGCAAPGVASRGCDPTVLIVAWETRQGDGKKAGSSAAAAGWWRWEGLKLLAAIKGHRDVAAGIV